MTIDEIKAEFERVQAGYLEYDAKVDQIGVELQVIAVWSRTQLLQVKAEINETARAMKKLAKTNKVIQHKIGALRDHVEKPDLAAIRHSLRAQRATIEVATKQADVVISHLDRVRKAGDKK